MLQCCIVQQSDPGCLVKFPFAPAHKLKPLCKPDCLLVIHPINLLLRSLPFGLEFYGCIVQQTIFVQAGGVLFNRVIFSSNLLLLRYRLNEINLWHD